MLRVSLIELPPMKPSDARTHAEAGLILARCDRLGDVLIASACLPVIRRQLGNVPLWLLAREPFLPLFEKSRLLAGAIAFTEDPEALAARLTATGAGVIAHLHPNPIAEEAAARAGIPARLGLARFDHGRHLTHPLPYRKKVSDRHEALQCFPVLAPLGIQPPKQADSLRPALAPDLDAARASVRDKLPSGFLDSPFACLAPFAHGDKPCPPPALTAALARHLHEHHNLQLALIGSEADHPTRPALMEALSPLPIVDLTGRTSLSETAALLTRARLHFSRDTGPAHLAAGLGTPTLTLFMEPDRYNRAARWRPLGERVRVIEQPAWRRPWESRTSFGARAGRRYKAEAIIAAVEELLNDDG